MRSRGIKVNDNSVLIGLMRPSKELCKKISQAYASKANLLFALIYIRVFFCPCFLGTNQWVQARNRSAIEIEIYRIKIIY